MILDDNAAIQLVKDNQDIPKSIQDARKYSTELCALFEGENFDEELIQRIEQIENDARAKARKKYSRDIVDCVARISKPIQNVFSSTGGVKNYRNGDTQLTETDQKKLLSMISNIRDGKSLERYIQNKWMPLYHSDPAGVQYLVYTTDSTGPKEAYPIYKSIGTIRNYLPKGQLVDWILFEPVKNPIDKTDNAQYWIIVDDARQIYLKQNGKDDITIVDDPKKTFIHPFGTAPIIINSDITDKNGARLSPFDDSVPILKEYARDLSIKIIYKFLQGFPKHWRRQMFCAACRGAKKDGDGNSCKICDGSGLMGKQDVTDDIIMPAEVFQEDQKLSGADMGGYFSPDLETWDRFNEELSMNEALAYETIWGCPPMKKKSATEKSDGPKTATQIVYDTQPQINKLNGYADVAEWMEWTLTEWLANLIDPAKKKDAAISLIVYGRRYIIMDIDTIQQKYEAAKVAGDTIGILDALYQELLTIKFKNDPEWMRIELIKSKVEPYLHWSVTDVCDMFGWKEAQRKIYFQQWWSDLDDNDFKGIDVETTLENTYNKDFAAYLQTVEYVAPGAPVPPDDPANNE